MEARAERGFAWVRNVMPSRKILLVHQFELNRVTGVRALLSELLWRIPAAQDGTAVAFECFEGYDDPDAFARALARRHGDATTVVGVNLHADLRFEYSIRVLDWCASSGRQVNLYVHDYYPKHLGLLESLVARYGCGLLASTEFIRDAMQADGFDVVLAPVGVPIGNVELGPLPQRDPSSQKVVGSIGRLVPRKRFEDVVAAFGSTGLAGRASLHLRLIASCVLSVDHDEWLLARIWAESERHRLGESIQIDRTPTERSDYRGYDAYVCASSYEGFSMTPIEAAYSGCPPLMSDIPAHQAIARSLFPERADDFLFPTGDTRALARLMADELESGRRAAYLQTRLVDVQELVESRLSPRRTAEVLVALADQQCPPSPASPADHGSRQIRLPSTQAENVADVEAGNPA
jgi:glycosyltransferase involved in cell wall biosynthesis